MRHSADDRPCQAKSLSPILQLTLLPLVMCLLTNISGVSHAAPPAFCWVDCGDEQLSLQEHGKTVMVFQLKPKSIDGQYSRANYVHPLYGPDGAMVTEDFPEDHRHHRGVFWAWHQLLLNGKPLADPWVCQNIQWTTPDESGNWCKTRADDRSAEMMVVRDWVVPDPERTGPTMRVVRETVRIIVWPSSEHMRILDFDLRFSALVEGISIGGSDDVKGYGGFSPRVRLADDVKFLGRQGEVQPQALAAVDGGAWIDVLGTLDGVQKGVAMMVHPSHPGFPLKWILRAKKSMQNPRWPGQQPVALPMQTELRLRYRLVLHTGKLDAKTLESIWKEYATDEIRKTKS